MKKITAFIFSLLMIFGLSGTIANAQTSANGTRVNGYYMLEDFEAFAIDYSYPKSVTQLSALVKTSVTNPSEKGLLYEMGSSGTSNVYVKINTALPTGKVLADFDSLMFNRYLVSVSYKQFAIWINGTKVHQVQFHGSNLDQGVVKIAFSAFNQAGAATVVANAGNNPEIGIGITDWHNSTSFYVDNVKLSGGLQDGGNGGDTGGETGGNTGGTEDLMLNNFNASTPGQTYSLKAWNTTDGTATVVADPVNPSNQVVNVVTSNWDAILQLTVTMPAGQTLGDYTGFSFDMFIPTNTGDDNPNFKNMFIYIDGEKKYEETSYPEQAPVATWTTKSYTLASLNLTEAEKAKATFTIAFGVSTDKGNYYIDNVKLTGGPGDNSGGPDGGVVNYIMDFNSNTIGQTYGMKAWNTADGTATVATDPANENNKAVQVVTSNWDAILRLDVVLPGQKALSNYDTFSFDIYFPTNAQDENPNYKNMFIFIDGVNKYEETNFPLQAPIATWTTKTFQLSSLNLTTAELAKNSFSLAFGVSTNNGNYFIDNVKITSSSVLTGNANPDAITNRVFVAGNTLYLADVDVDRVSVYDLRGSLHLTAQNTSSMDVSGLSNGIYIVKTEVNGKVFVNKIIR